MLKLDQIQSDVADAIDHKQHFDPNRGLPED
jgi:hypothetical protein